MADSNTVTDSLPYAISCGYNSALIIPFSIYTPWFLYLAFLNLHKTKTTTNDVALILPSGRFWKFFLIPARIFSLNANVEINLQLIVLRGAMPAASYANAKI
jgi:hypothetical protein